MTDAEFEQELVEALNMLLEDERASVEMEVALASGATEYGEREALAAMGVEDIHFCEQLRIEMEQAGLAVTPQINGVVFQVIGAERYDDRLRAFAHHQRVVAEHARELQESNLEGALRDALEGITVTHDRHTQWTEQRASAFAATRTLEFGGPGRSGLFLPDDAEEEDHHLPSEQARSEDSTSPAPAEDSAPTELPAEGAAADDEAHSNPHDEQSDEEQPPFTFAAEPDHVAEPATTPAARPKPRSARLAPAAKARAKPATTRAKAVAKPKPVTATPRRTRRTPTTGETGETGEA
jgi:hypothetical protein